MQYATYLYLRQSFLRKPVYLFWREIVQIGQRWAGRPGYDELLLQGIYTVFISFL